MRVCLRGELGQCPQNWTSLHFSGEISTRHILVPCGIALPVGIRNSEPPSVTKRPKPPKPSKPRTLPLFDGTPLGQKPCPKAYEPPTRPWWKRALVWLAQWPRRLLAWGRRQLEDIPRLVLHAVIVGAVTGAVKIGWDQWKSPAPSPPAQTSPQPPAPANKSGPPAELPPWRTETK
jgi:hypothetical protein